MADELQEDQFSSDESLDDEEGSESESDVDAKLADDDVFDIQFLKCYSALKKKDEKIYDQNVRFFENDDESSSDEAKPSNDETNIASNIGKSAPPKMTLLDLQLRAESCTDDIVAADNPKIDLDKEVSKSYYEKELEEIKKSIEEVGGEADDSDDDFLVVKGSKDPKEAGEKPRSKISSLLDKMVDEDGEDIDHLKQVWCNPDKLSKEDKYLRDYILNKRYLPSNVNVDDDGNEGFFSKNIDELSDVASEEDEPTTNEAPVRHSDEQDFDKIARIPRNSTKTIRDMVEKREKREKRAKKLEKEKKKKKSVLAADCEDVIGDLPTRFHYRQTEANDFGLTAEELLMATDEELDQWVNLKECVAYKSLEEELEQKRKFDALRDNMELKRKIFKSVYADQSNEENPVEDVEAKLSKKKRSRKRKRDTTDEEPDTSLSTNIASSELKTELEQKKDKKKKHRRRGLNHKKFAKVGVAPDRLLAYGLSKTKLKKRKLL